MFKISLILGLNIALFTCLLVIECQEQDWEYVMEKFEWDSSDKKLVSTNLRPVRISRSVYGLNGTINVGVEVDNTFTVGIRILRSISGTSKFLETPLRIPKQKYYNFMNNYYKKYAMEVIRKCSNFPVFEGNLNTPSPIGEYYFNSCVMSSEKMPQHLWTGYYKIVVEVDGPPVHFNGTLTSNVFSKN